MSGFSLIEVLIGLAVSALAVLLLASIVRMLNQTQNRVTELKESNDITNVIQQVVNANLCDWSIRAAGTGARVPFSGTATDIQLERNDPTANPAIHSVLMTTGNFGLSTSLLKVNTLQLSEVMSGVGRITKKPLYYSILARITAGSTTVDQIRTPAGVTIPNIISAFGIVPPGAGGAFQVSGRGIQNDPTNPVPFFGSQVTAVSATTLTLSLPAKVSQNPVFLQIGAFYTIYSASVDVSYTDSSQVGAVSLKMGHVPVLVAVGISSGTLDRCYGTQDITSLCNAMGGVLDSNGSCSKTAYDRFSNTTCSAANVWGGHDCTGMTKNCYKVYVMTGMQSTGDPICECVKSCSP
jgi:prepilin-type N-terminal cleavage/methylation domain-containing protein